MANLIITLVAYWTDVDGQVTPGRTRTSRCQPRGEPKMAPKCCSVRSMINQLQELAQARFLVASKKPGFGQHAFDHGPHVVPILADARAHEVVPGAGAGAM